MIGLRSHSVVFDTRTRLVGARRPFRTSLGGWTGPARAEGSVGSSPQAGSAATPMAEHASAATTCTHHPREETCMWRAIGIGGLFLYLLPI
jgi:hypothetical protein